MKLSKRKFIFRYFILRIRADSILVGTRPNLGQRGGESQKFLHNMAQLVFKLLGIVNAKI